MPLVIIVTLLQVPFVRDNIEGVWLRDTTSIIHHLEAKYPDKVVITRYKIPSSSS